LLTFEDLLAAKVALQMGLVQPEAARQTLMGAIKSGRNFVQELEAVHAVDTESAKTIAAHARRCSFLKAESTYLGILRKKGVVDEATIEKARARQHQESLRSRLGSYLIQEGKITKDLDQAVLGEARTSFLADNAQVTERYAARNFEGIEKPSVTVSEVIGQTAARPAQPAATTPTSSRPPLAQRAAQTSSQANQKALLDFGATPPDLGADLAGIGHSAEHKVPAAVLAPPPPADAGPLRGTGLEERYTVLKKLGEGGMGAVYLAREEATKREVALKLVLDQEKSKEAALRFKREILATSMCGHENVIEIYDAGETKDGSFFMAMEYVPGEELSEIIKREGGIRPLRCLDLFEQILEGIAAVHSADIVHRDLKPPNFRIWKDGTGRERVKIMDFGIARVRNADGQFGDAFYRTMGGKITGSPAYIAPESITEPDVDGRADLYSLGIACFRMVTGKLPYSCKDPMEYLPKHLYEKPPVPSVFAPSKGIPKELDQMVLKLLEKRPEARYQTAAEVLEDLRRRVRPSLSGASDLSGSTSETGLIGSAEGTKPQLPIPIIHGANSDAPGAVEATQTEMPPPPARNAPTPPATKEPERHEKKEPVMPKRNRPRVEGVAEKKGCLGFLFGRKKA
jgi:serine/threonine-protein kinase